MWKKTPFWKQVSFWPAWIAAVRRIGQARNDAAVVDRGVGLVRLPGDPRFRGDDGVGTGMTGNGGDGLRGAALLQDPRFRGDDGVGTGMTE